MIPRFEAHAAQLSTNVDAWRGVRFRHRPQGGGDYAAGDDPDRPAGLITATLNEGKPEPMGTSGDRRDQDFRGRIAAQPMTLSVDRAGLAGRRLEAEDILEEEAGLQRRFRITAVHEDGARLIVHLVEG